jgi:hypothetical protein
VPSSGTRKPLLNMHVAQSSANPSHRIQVLGNTTILQHSLHLKRARPMQERSWNPARSIWRTYLGKWILPFCPIRNPASCVKIFKGLFLQNSQAFSLAHETTNCSRWSFSWGGGLLYYL